jgi:uncharacterized protein (UPF0276 family)
MKFAVNYSAPLVHLLDEGAVHIDLIKCPDWEGMLEEAKDHGKITIHFDLEVGLGNTFHSDFSRIRALMERTYTPHVNTHLVTPRQFNPDNTQELDQINALWREEIRLMTEELGPDTVALEHHPYTHANPNIRPAADPEVFSQVIQDTGCMLLLDLAHARITAHTLGVKVQDYIHALPLERLVEMHVTGIRTLSGVLTDHFELGEDDWSTLVWALEQIGTKAWHTPEIVAFEYGGIGSTFVWRTDPDVLRNQVPVMFDMLRNIS